MKDAFSIFLLVVGAGVIAGVAYWYFKTGDRERVEEDDAREFFERHGHWPDQTAEEAAEERRRAAAWNAAAATPVTRPADDGSV